MTHTPGPWTFEGGQWIIGPNGERLAQVMNWNADYLDKGQLMASAPELLEALEEALHRLSQPDDYQARDWHYKAQAAIKKARGT